MCNGGDPESRQPPSCAHFSSGRYYAGLGDFCLRHSSRGLPAACDYAPRHEDCHDFEHICFLASSIMFWWVIIHPWTSRIPTSSWTMVLYLMSADIVNTALSAFLAFCDKPVYSFYVTGPNPFHVSPVSDQVLGAIVMWVLGSFVFLVPAILITVQLLAPEKTNILAQQDASRGAG